ncbi:DUF2249 domain-containing protein [Pullulanibacillus camelliae]|nr:DUF2249 domain-containing protein [Pullulanibacillus camelliae]
MENQSNIVELDVRPYLRKKIEPFKIIMATVKDLREEDTFILHATFNPKPLISVMKRKGFASSTEKVDKKHWVITFNHKSREDALVEQAAKPQANKEKRSVLNKGPQLYKLDNRGLEPPNPMIRTLNQLELCHPGDKVIIHNDRVPVFLIEELNTLGYSYIVEEQGDGSAHVIITKN